MKKAIFGILLLCSVLISSSVHGQPSTTTVAGNSISTSVIKSKSAYSMDANFQSVDVYPSSFLIQSSVLYNYFNSFNSLYAGIDTNVYLHVYFAADNNDSIRLILVPTTWNDTNYVHDPTIDTFFITCLAQPNLYNVYDTKLDATDTNDNGNNNNASLCITNKVDTATARVMIRRFQREHPNMQKPIVNKFMYKFTQSFMFEAEELNTFITNNPTDPTDPTTLNYIQIYLSINPEATTMDKLTLIFVGLDGNGNHMYYHNNNVSAALNIFNKVLDECMPCPQCGAVLDSHIDDNPQFRKP